MHLPPSIPAYDSYPTSSLSQSASRPSDSALHKVENISNELPPLRLQYQAARQVGPALACRQVNAFIEAGQAELYPGLRKCRVILSHSRVTPQPAVAERPLPPQAHLGTITHVLLGHVGGERLPSVQEQTALCSFLQGLDEIHSSALQAGQHDPFMALPHQCDNNGHSLFYLSVAKGLAGLVQWLLDTQPATFSVTNLFTGENDKKIPPLCLAVEKGDVKMATLLLDRDAAFKNRRHLQAVFLRRAIRQSDAAMVTLLLDRGDGRRHLQAVCLRRAIRQSDAAMVTLLLDRGADINCNDVRGDYLLHWASRINNVGMATLLLDRGVHIHCRNDNGETALHWACGMNNVDVATLLLDRGVHIRCRNDNGETALHWACGMNNVDVATLLLDRGADVNCVNGYGETVLHWAVRAGSTDITTLLVGRGANIHGRNENGDTALHWAISYGEPDVTTLLLDRGVEVNGQNRQGETALHWAAKKRGTEMATLVLDRGADVNVVDKKGRTPLFYAVEKDKVDMITLLLDRGARDQAPRSSQ